MKCEFWLTLTPKRDADGDVVDVRVTKMTQDRPRRAHGIAVPVSLEIAPELFEPLRIEGELDADTETVVLQAQPVEEE